MVNNKANIYRAHVAADIRNALIKVPARNGKPAQYWSQKEQEERLKVAYTKWSDKGGVWSAATPSVCLDNNWQSMIF